MFSPLPCIPNLCPPASLPTFSITSRSPRWAPPPLPDLELGYSPGLSLCSSAGSLIYAQGLSCCLYLIAPKSPGWSSHLNFRLKYPQHLYISHSHTHTHPSPTLLLLSGRLADLLLTPRLSEGWREQSVAARSLPPAKDELLQLHTDLDNHSLTKAPRCLCRPRIDSRVPPLLGPTSEVCVFFS